MPLDEVKVSVLDRAFLFGEAIYEVLRVYGGQIWRFEDHLQRLQDGLQSLQITNVNLDQLRNNVTETLNHSHLQEALIYIQVTRGAAARSHAFPAQTNPNQLIYVEKFLDAFAEYRQHGASAITHNDIRWSRNDLKTTSLVANCMLAQAAAQQGCLEAILIDKDGFVTEGSHSSIFAVLDGQLLIAPSGPQVLPGITKKQVLELAADSDISIRQHRLQKSELQSIGELFLTATPEEIIPITKVDNHQIGNGQPGPVTRKLQASFQAKLSQWLQRKQN